MSHQLVLERGNLFLEEYPRDKPWWNVVLHFTCGLMIMASKTLLNLLYNPTVHHVERLDAALARARAENRALLTVMNHMSVVDDPGFYSMLPVRFFADIDTIRWGFGAHNICFLNPALLWFFNLGKILGTKRFGEGPFQGSIDAAIRILSPEQTDSDLAAGPSTSGTVSQFFPPDATQTLLKSLPFVRSKTSWFHVFPEGFVLQLEPPENNLMRYFKWGVARLLLEASRPPIVVPLFGYGFEKIAPEASASSGLWRWLPQNMGSEVHLTVGPEMADDKINAYRAEWQALCTKYADPAAPGDLLEPLRTGPEAQSLRSRVAADLRQQVAAIREQIGAFLPEKLKFQDPAFWHEYTVTEGASDPSVKFIGQNWAIRRLQKHLPEYEEDP